MLVKVILTVQTGSEEQTVVTLSVFQASRNQQEMFFCQTCNHYSSVDTLCLCWTVAPLKSFLDTCGVLHVSMKTSPYVQLSPPEQVPVLSSVTGKLSPHSLLDAHILFPPGLWEHLHLISCAADLPLPSDSPVRLPQPHSNSCIEHLLQILLCECRTLDVCHCPDFVCQSSGVFL